MVTISILGAGFMGSAHAASYKSLGGRVRVKTICARSLERAEKLAVTVGAAGATDVVAATGDPEVDAVDICLPTPLHREAAERAFAAGKHVFLEKPIALTKFDADAIVEAAQRSGRILMVGMVLRFWPEYVELQRRLAAGELGRTLAVSTHRLSPPADWNDWMRDPEQSGGTGIDLLIHDFDQMNRLFGKPLSVYAREPTAGHVQAIVEYEAAAGIAEGSMAMPKSYPFSSSIRVLAEGGVAEYSFTAAPAEDGGNIGTSDARRGLHLYTASGGVQMIPVERGDPWESEMSYFIDCVEEGQDPEQGTGEQARQALLVSLAANRSLASGRVEPV